MTISVHQSDCVAWLREHDGPLFDAVVTDPPYHLTSIVKRFGGAGASPAQKGRGSNATGAYARASKGFMGKKWDGGDVAFRAETWAAVFDRMKPGAHLVAFSGTRTYHRMACAIEDAGFEIRDCLMWVYGSGFPKYHNVSKGIDRELGQLADREITGYKKQGPKSMFDGGRPRATSLPASLWAGWATALKPALEPICLARKPLSEKNIAANVLKHGTGAINIDACRVGTDEDTRRNATGGDNGLHGTNTFKIRDRKADEKEQPAGRWPANWVHDGSDEVLTGFPETSSSVGIKGGSSPNPMSWGDGRSDAGVVSGHDDSGSAARFFYSAKAGPLDRIGTAHPTVKPVDLMRWLVRLVTPPGGLVLDPFAGSGTTGIACMAEGFDCTLIDLEADHVADINRKLAFLRGEGATRFAEHQNARTARNGPASAGPLFGGDA